MNAILNTNSREMGMHDVLRAMISQYWLVHCMRAYIAGLYIKPLTISRLKML